MKGSNLTFKYNLPVYIYFHLLASGSREYMRIQALCPSHSFCGDIGFPYPSVGLGNEKRGSEWSSCAPGRHPIYVPISSFCCVPLSRLIWKPRVTYTYTYLLAWITAGPWRLLRKWRAILVRTRRKPAKGCLFSEYHYTRSEFLQQTSLFVLTLPFFVLRGGTAIFNENIECNHLILGTSRRKHNSFWW